MHRQPPPKCLRGYHA